MKPQPLLHLHPVERFEQPMAEMPEIPNMRQRFESAGFTNTRSAWAWKLLALLLGLAVWGVGFWFVAMWRLSL